GIFPIVHGARALALQYRLRVLGTAARLRALVARECIDEALARDLVDALHFLIELKLRNNLAQRRLGRLPDNRLQIASLGTLERDALKDSLAIVRRFRQWLARHYRLDSI
ncbi:MAG TPA: putative nucleotidyltransferase substrate binding domain-containing protein, partial [Burkholderiaceae bacterium]|nr:putative nucleotidyltransferase substrate binding domain-containing protein [Burkholderiaceae bacterium]